MIPALPIRAARGQRSVLDVSGHLPVSSPLTAALLASLADWWAERAVAAGLSGRWLDVDWAVMNDQSCPVNASSTPASLSGTAEEIGEAYVSSLPNEERSRYGRHYTPSGLAVELWEMTKRAMGWKRPQQLTGMILDPACGAAGLLLPILREHLGTVARVDAQLALKALPNHIMGIDNDPNAVWLGNVLLAAEMLPVLARTERARRQPLPALIRHGDGLAPLGQPVQAVIMNPPYGRVKLSTEERLRFAESLYGHANIYALFMAAALESLDLNGVVSALVPTSFLSGRYFENLRTKIRKTASLREVSFVASRGKSFTGVLQETCLASFSRPPNRRVTVNYINGKVSEIGQVKAPHNSGPWLLPRRVDDASVAAIAISMPLTLKQIGWKISTGPLVWNRRKSDLYARPGKSRVPVIWAADIDGGVIHRDKIRDDTRYLKIRDIDEKIMILDEPAVLIQRTTAPEQPRRMVAAYLSAETLAVWGGRVIIENHVNVARPSDLDPALSASDLTRFFSTDTVDRILRCLTGSIAVSAYELSSLPMPNREILAGWATLNEEQFNKAVALTYRPVFT